MKNRRDPRQTLVALLIGVLVGGGLMLVAPAGAEVAAAAATNWGKIWKKNLKPLADKRYYRRAASDKRYAPAGSAYSKAEVDTKLGGYPSKVEADAKYATKAESAAAASAAESGANATTDAKLAGYLTATQSDAKYAPYPRLLRGTYSVIAPASAPGQEFSNSVSFGVQFPSPPTAHYIAAGDAPPAGCSGTYSAPNASPGHLCLFEKAGVNVAARTLFGVEGIPGSASEFGFNPIVSSAAAGTVYCYGGWAARPGGAVTSAIVSSGAAAIGE